jgi:hypothetical protein
MYDGDAQKDPSQAPTISVWTPGGENKVNEATCTLNAGTNFTYTISSSLMPNYEENYRMQTTVVYGGKTYYFNFLFDVVRQKIYSDVRDSDLLLLHPDLADNRWENETTFEDVRKQAFSEVLQDIKDRGRRAEAMMDAGQVKHLQVYKALELCFFDWSKEHEDIMWMKYERYKDKYEKALKSLQIKYDIDEDQIIDTQGNFAVTQLRR